MEQFIRYLYEYQDGQPVRNVGFVKVEQKEAQTTVHIHGKGLRLGNEISMKLYIFYVEQEAPVRILQGTVTNINPAINYRLTFGDEDTGRPENYPLIKGIIMESDRKRMFAAVWSDSPIRIEAMQDWKEPDPVPMTMTEAVEDAVAGSEKAEQTDESARAAVQTNEKAEEFERTNEKDEEDKQTAGGNSMPDSAVSKAKEEDTSSSGIRYKKIRRQDIAILPRCEWRLANNSFLLHGCYNYHHLILIEDGNESWLGVPGIYHRREAKAAETFGFPRFVRLGDTDVELGSNEKGTTDDFGYWCRRVKRMNNRAF